MMSDKKMKPCPFCRVHLHWLNQAWRHLQHNKRHCVLHEIAITDEDAWNNRPAENELEAGNERLKFGPMRDHKCKKVVEAGMGPNREEWIGELLEPISGHEKETHCWHIKTPYRTIVFGIVPEDLYAVAALAEVIHGKPINPRWLTNLAKKYKKLAEQGIS